MAESGLKSGFLVKKVEHWLNFSLHSQLIVSDPVRETDTFEFDDNFTTRSRSFLLACVILFTAGGGGGSVQGESLSRGSLSGEGVSVQGGGSLSGEEGLSVEGVSVQGGGLCLEEEGLCPERGFLWGGGLCPVRGSL